MIFEVTFKQLDLGIGGIPPRHVGYIEIPDSRNCKELRDTYEKELSRYGWYELTPIAISDIADLLRVIRAASVGPRYGF